VEHFAAKATDIVRRSRGDQQQSYRERLKRLRWPLTQLYWMCQSAALHHINLKLRSATVDKSARISYVLKVSNQKIQPDVANSFPMKVARST